MIKRFVPLMPFTHSKTAIRAFKKEVQEHLPKKTISRLSTKDYIAVVDYHMRHDSRKNLPDLDNLLKQTLDVVKGSLIADDRQVKEIHAKLTHDTQKHGFYITLHPIKKITA